MKITTKRELFLEHFKSDEAGDKSLDIRYVEVDDILILLENTHPSDVTSTLRDKLEGT